MNLAESLSVKTLEAARAYFLKIGENPEHLTPERVKKLLENHFEALLDFRFDDSFTRGDVDFEIEKQNVLSKLPEADKMDIKAREELGGDLWAIFAAGYLNGYAAGVKDTETLLYTLKEAEEKGTSLNTPTETERTDTE